MLETVAAYGLQFLVPIADEGVGRSLKEAGEFARPEVDFILSACRGDLLDVGANIGAIALPFAAARREARVVAVEAHRKLSQVLAANALNNGLYNVEVENVVAGERRGLIEIPHVPLTTEKNIGATSLYDKNNPFERARMAPIDDIAPSNVAFVKIDVEGFEPRVLDGANRLLKEVRPSWLVEVSRERTNTTNAVRSVFSDAGYKLFWFFSPFVTKMDDRDVRGDYAIFATDAVPTWPLTPVGEGWPTSLSDYPYLDRYGIDVSA